MWNIILYFLICKSQGRYIKYILKKSTKLSILLFKKLLQIGIDNYVVKKTVQYPKLKQRQNLRTTKQKLRLLTQRPFYPLIL